MSRAHNQKQLLNWYDKNRRSLPWRATGQGNLSDPYHVWLSEIMLQQTGVVVVIDYFLKFIRKWPDIHALANADLDDVLTEWAGLGYYARARNLYKCAKIISAEYKGVFPRDETKLLALPGIGPYTVSAIRSIAFNEQACAMDGNVERVVSRFFAVTDPLPSSKPLLKTYALELTDNNPSPADFTQAFMELGATVCTPKKIKCPECPWQDDCKAYAQDIASELPKRLKKPAKPVKGGTVFFIQRDDGRFLIQRRPEKGLLGGMMELPSTNWVDRSEHQKLTSAEKIEQSSVILPDWDLLNGSVKHTFTHFHLYLDIMVGNAHQTNEVIKSNKAIWISKDDIGNYALPSLMQKVVKLITSELRQK